MQNMSYYFGFPSKFSSDTSFFKPFVHKLGWNFVGHHWIWASFCLKPLSVLTRRKPERANSRSPSMTAPSPTTSKSWAADGVWSTSRRSIRRATRSTSSSTASRFQDARLSVKLPIRVSLIAGLGSRKMLKIQDISYLYHRKVIFGQFSAIFLQYMYLKYLKIHCFLDTFSKYPPQPCPINRAFCRF